MKDTDAEDHGADSESRRDVPPAEPACVLLPLRHLHLPDKLHLIPAQLVF